MYSYNAEKCKCCLARHIRVWLYSVQPLLHFIYCYLTITKKRSSFSPVTGHLGFSLLQRLMDCKKQSGELNRSVHSLIILIIVRNRTTKDFVIPNGLKQGKSSTITESINHIRLSKRGIRSCSCEVQFDFFPESI